MKVTEIVVSAGRTFNHPYESYSNLKPGLTLKATLEDGEDATEAIKTLQAKAESLVEDHKRHLLNSLEEIHDLQNKQREAADLERTIQRAQSSLDRLRAGMNGELQPALAVDDEDPQF